ncbi:tyrosine-type recombinase/integrase [Planosporangium mesophilum]|uniref:tyrosine-type recombinase/integrase n=1 Tax=Planosporangium mesophilum TaxID=689768 RepID=UPI001EF21520|nr:site-specific integrase [Planosporangium mesophilum]
MSGADIEAARLLLDRLGVSPEQVMRGAGPRRPMPTFDEYIGRVSHVVTDATRSVYETYWAKVRQVWGARRLDEPTPLEIHELAEWAKRQSVTRRNSRGGRASAEHVIAALRCLYRYAVMDGLIAEADSPAARVAKPRRLPSTRRAISATHLAQINAVAASTGNDPELDRLLLRLHTETACRRAGALGLRLCDIDSEQCLVRLREKGETVRWQPISPTLTRYLLLHNEERGTGDPSGQLLRYGNGKPITARRYDYLWQRLGKHLPWVAIQQISTHWLRHTTLTWVERNFGYAVARAYAGHSGKNDAGTTSTYVRADLYEVAAALAALTGEPHPLAVDSR